MRAGAGIGSEYRSRVPGGTPWAPQHWSPPIPPSGCRAGWNAFYYWGVWAVCIVCVGIVLWAALRSDRWTRWTTQDILIVAALGVLLEVYDNIIGDQLIGPLLNPIPGADFVQIQDLPYMFLLMVGVALVRKPGCVTAMVFVNFLLAQLLFGSGHGALDWTDGLTQGIFCDVYIVARRGGCTRGARACGPW